MIIEHATRTRPQTSGSDTAGNEPDRTPVLSTDVLPDDFLSSVFVVVPAYNEGSTIGQVVRELRATIRNVVVVDDGSTDETGSAAEAGGAIVVRHALNRGQGAALQTGLDFSLQRGAQYIVTFDSDGQHSAGDVPALLAPLFANTADVSLGSRFLGSAIDMPFRRKMLLRCAVMFTRVSSGLRVTDTHNGLRAFTRAVAERINLRMDRMAHASEILDQIQRSGVRYLEVPVSIRYTEYSKRKGQRSLSAIRVLLDYLFGRWMP